MVRGTVVTRFVVLRIRIKRGFIPRESRVHRRDAATGLSLCTGITRATPLHRRLRCWRFQAGVLYAVNGNPVQVEARSEADGSLLWSWVPPKAAETGFVSEPFFFQNLVFAHNTLVT